MLEKIMQFFDSEDILKADGFDEAIIGFCEHSQRLIYSVSECIKILEKDMTEEEADEYFWFNIHQAYVGEKTPIWCIDNI
jgi:hypothetical protein